jgi:hypothetical protein
MDWAAEDSKFDAGKNQEIFAFSVTSRQALMPTEFRIQTVKEAVSLIEGGQNGTDSNVKDKTVSEARNQCIGGNWWAYSSVLKMEALCSSETCAYFRGTTWLIILEDRTFNGSMRNPEYTVLNHRYVSVPDRCKDVRDLGILTYQLDLNN